MLRALIAGLRALGKALLDLLAAEVAEIQRELGQTGRSLGGIAIRLGFVAALGFWSLGALLFAAMAGLAYWLPLWAAALVLAAALGLAAILLYRLTRSRIATLESPVGTVRRRVDDHLAFMQRLLGSEAAPGAPSRRSAPRPARSEEEEW